MFYKISLYTVAFVNILYCVMLFNAASGKENVVEII